MDSVTLLGLVAATCTTIAFLPQVVKNWRTKSAGDLSFGTFGLFTTGVVLWLMYGALIGNLPIIVSNVITLALNVANLIQMVWYRRTRATAGRHESPL
jgi:MtN3 and saliva related transmembrane protein